MHLARPKAAGSKVRASMSGGAGTDTLDLRVLYSVLADYQRGNFTVRMPDDRTGLAGKICDALNTTIERNERLVKELERLSTVVGKAGNVKQRAQLPSAEGAWSTAVESVNTLVSDLVQPTSEVARLHASSGTKGKPTVVGYTAGDLDVWREVMARLLVAAGARPGDMLHVAFGYGLFTGGLGFHDGAERVGLTVVPVSSGNTARHQLLLERDRERQRPHRLRARLLLPRDGQHPLGDAGLHVAGGDDRRRPAD